MYGAEIYQGCCHDLFPRVLYSPRSGQDVGEPSQEGLSHDARQDGPSGRRGDGSHAGQLSHKLPHAVDIIMAGVCMHTEECL